MKAHNPTLAIVLSLSLGGTTLAAGPSESQSEGQGIRFRDAERAIPVVFEDESLSQEARTAILDDCRLLLCHLCAGDRRELSAKRTVVVGGLTLRVSKALVYTKGRQKLPNGYGAEYGILGVTQDGEEHFLVPTRLSDAYRTALRLREEQPNVFSQLEEFVRFMNNLNRAELATMPGAGEVMYLHGDAAKYRDEAARMTASKFVREFGKQRYGVPSMLDVKKGTGDLMDMLVTKMRVMDATTLETVDELPLVYQAGRWKILITIPGT